jgi:hypothetical protein
MNNFSYVSRPIYKNYLLYRPFFLFFLLKAELTLIYLILHYRQGQDDRTFPEGNQPKMANQEIMQSPLPFTKKLNKCITDVSSSLSTLHLRGGWGDPDVDIRDGTRGSNTDIPDYDSDDTMMSYPLDDVRGGDGSGDEGNVLDYDEDSSFDMYGSD